MSFDPNVAVLPPVVAPEVPELEECPICLSELDGRIKEIACHQKYHQECIDQWLNAKDTCPKCRYDVAALAPEQLPARPQRLQIVPQRVAPLNPQQQAQREAMFRNVDRIVENHNREMAEEAARYRRDDAGHVGGMVGSVVGAAGSMVVSSILLGSQLGESTTQVVALSALSLGTMIATTYGATLQSKIKPHYIALLNPGIAMALVGLSQGLSATQSVVNGALATGMNIGSVITGAIAGHAAGRLINAG